jgi:hypothetical protein
MTINSRRALLVSLSLLLTFVALRLYLQLSPGTNLNVGGYNVHHLFTGLLLVTIGGLPLVLFHGDSRRFDLLAIVFGAGLSMALDEWVYLITTDGRDTSYLLPISFWGGIAMVGFALIYMLILVFVARRCKCANSALQPTQTSRG